jgi:probable HAF family extracellular repeat protein
MVLRGISRCAAIASVAGGIGTAAVAQPAFHVITPLPGGQTALITSISGDGMVAGGMSLAGGQQHAVRWTQQLGLVDMGVFPGGTQTNVQGVSQGGGVFVGAVTISPVTRAWRWSDGAWTNLGLLPGLPNTASSVAFDVSGDGNVVVGYCASGSSWGFRWTPSGGMVDIGTFPGFQQVQSFAVSRDGLVVVGGAVVSAGVGHAFRWAGGVMQDLGTPPGMTSSTAYATNQNGSAVAGRASPDTTHSHMFRWTAAGGMQDIGVLPGYPNVLSGASMSADGSLIVGGCAAPGSDLRACIWSPLQGMRDMNALVQAMGINLNGRRMTSVSGISDDGTVLVGGLDDNTSWVLDLRGDTDGDGLQDDWEINGIPYVDALGAARRYELPGANPAHKDLYVEVDRMAGISLDSAAVNMVIQAFAASPMTNPDGASGVSLHVQVDEADLPYLPVWHTSNGCWPDSFDQYLVLHYGTPAERADPAGLPLLLAKQKACRYGILADRSDADLGGCGKINGDWFVVYTGGAGPSTENQATAFMHELGHNLGLRHGGGDEYNGKPNYPSIMNYVTAYKAAWNEGFWRLDYSRVGPEGFATLNELELDETAGIGTLLGYYHDWVMPFGVNVAAGGPRAVRYALLNGSPVDYGSPNGNGVPDGQYGTGIIQDLNYVANPPAGVHLPSQESGGDHLAPYNDWEHVVLATSAARGPSAPLVSDPTGELQIAARDWMAANFPPPGGPAPCYANCDASTTAPVLNVLDFNCFLNRFAAGASYANCDGSTTPPVLNVLDFNCFLNRFAAGCP